MAAPQWNLIAYDVRDPKRLRKASKILEGYGERIQFIVFACESTKKSWKKFAGNCRKFFPKSTIC